MNPADTAPTGQPGTAPGEELSIPKHRFDEVLAKVKRLEDEVAIKDRLYTEDRQRFSQAIQPKQVEVEETAEELGIDPNTYQAVKKLASRIAGKVIKEKEEIFGQQIGILAGRTEKAELLAEKGSDKAKYLPEVDRKQKEHWQRTGTFLPAGIALDLILSDQTEQENRALKAKLAKLEKGETVEPEKPQSVPNAAATRQIPGGAPPSGPKAKSTAEMNLEELEAYLEGRFKAGEVL